MRRAELVIALLILGLLLPIRPLRAAMESQWQAQGRHARLELVASEGEAAQARTWSVALPSRGGWRVVGLELDGQRRDPAGLLRLSRPFVFRRVRVGQILLAAEETPWRKATVDLAFDAELPVGRVGAIDPFLDGLLLNPEQASPRPRAISGRTGDEIFDGSSRWIRIDVTSSGVYHLDYDELWTSGVPLGTDTGSFRLLGTGGRSQSFRMGWGGSWERGWTLPEIPIQVGGGESFNEATELSFYLPGLDGFEDEFGPGAGWEDYRRNAYAVWATYYLTWDGEAGVRVGGQDASPTGGDPVLATLPAKLHREENQSYSNKYLHEDGWAWRYFPRSPNATQFENAFSLAWPDASQPFRLRVGFDAPRGTDFLSGPHHLTGYLGEKDEEHQLFDEVFYIGSALSQELLVGERVLPADMDGIGESKFILGLPRDPPTGLEKDFGYLLWYEVYYHTHPRTRFSAPLVLHVPADEASAEIRVSGWDHEPEVWDVTDPFATVLLTGGDWEGDSLRLRFDTPAPRRLLCVDPQSGAGYRRVDRVGRVAPRLLRNENDQPHMLVIHFDGFTSAAERYAAWRRGNFPLLGQGDVKTVAVSDIYANFGGGMQDPAALRNYLKYCYESPGSRLSYVLLLGDASYDYRNFLSHDTLGDGTNCLVPSLSDRFRTDRLLQPYTTDDYICCLDVEDDSVEVSVPDLAVGRLAASSLEMADQMVDMVIAYETAAPDGVWRNRVALAADDYFLHCDPDEFDGIGHTSDAEILYKNGFPSELDIEKIYLCEWECDYAGFKPLAQQKLFAEMEEGVLIFNYVGHGGNDVLSDEQLLLTTRLHSLSNADRRFLFISASCNVGKYDDPSNESMSETMLSLPQGGAIATMASSALSSASFNNILNRNFLQELFPDGSLTARTPVGLCLLRAKVKTQLVDMPSNQIGVQNERYSILGDPSLGLPTPRLEVELTGSAADTLPVGGSRSLSGRILREGLFAPDFNGELLLSVRASADTSGYVYYRQVGDSLVERHVPYHLAGPEIFRGRVPVGDGRFETPAFFIPGLPDSALGPFGRIRAFAVSGYEQAVGTLDSLAVEPGILPVDDTPPDVALSLAGGAAHGSPGMELLLRTSAPSGINFVGTHPHNSIFLEYVEAGQVENWTQRFEYDLGSASEGEVRGTLPAGLPYGPNTLVASVADNLGNVGRDTLRVHVFEEGRADLTAVQPFPNPFDRRCAISFELTEAAEVECVIYTISGRRIRRLEMECPEPRRYAFDWNGRDESGDEVGNGTYLYRLVASFGEESLRRRECSGAVVRIRD